MIEIKNMVVGYNKIKLLEIDNLKFNMGDLIIIHGQSGCGKTTLLNVIARLQEQISGEVYYNGNILSKSLTEKSISLYKKEFSYIAQTPLLINNKTAIENLSFINKDINTHEVLESVNLSDLADIEVSKLSGGQKQRLSIAMSMLKGSNVIFADEPTGNLDTINKEIIFNLFKAQAKSGKLVIIVSHDEYFINNAYRAINLEDYTINEN